MKKLRLALLMFGVLPMSLMAQDAPQPTSRPALASGERPTTRPLRTYPFMDGMRKYTETPTEGEWEKARTFMAETLPNSLMMFQNMPPERPNREEVRRAIYGRYQELQQLKDRKDDGKMYEIKVAQAKASDQMLGAMFAWRRAESVAEKQQYRSQLRSLLQQRMELELNERELRIEHLKQQLAKEEERLAGDLKHVKSADGTDSTLDARVDALLIPWTRGFGQGRFGPGRFGPPARDAGQTPITAPAVPAPAGSSSNPVN